ncbi:methylated-DNA-[protein]-cysteine S-methyltransferase [Pullulanibacillus pueri]|uniref:Methylated-DNA--protein-cysteine methyltransferase n=1 Tax=Pullulanibacillus pueri TaxID=1437324 RepID=A0A8J2ZX07_9BACL|nr:methylated-DNA--[protein]-cysteine S-methyltransferase [Pullulanibacillus pueri]MBM7683582.1 methylated-DNA-[protein]-cysteine S-methyltransferase [Pullulanibacillus pueri]GGH84503.1 methylated-DNA--protein-cysteine methyltransferase [Pullulanibacillus pueri]
MEKQPLIYVGETESPIGALTVACIGKGVCYVAFGSIQETEIQIKAWANKHMLHNELISDSEHTALPIQQLQEYFAGERRQFTVPLCLKGTPFQKKVWTALQDIEYGKTQSYKQLAESIGRPKAVRAVGRANNQNPLAIFIPCHRVVGSNGALVGYGGGLSKKEYLLNLERKHAAAE